MWEAIALTGMASMHTSIGEHEKAIGFATDARKLFQETGAGNYETRALYWMARIDMARGRMDDALDYSAAALAAIESTRASVARRDLQISFFATASEQYELEIEILMRLHRERPAGRWDAKAFEVFERARARGLIDSLGEMHADVRQGVPADLLDREQSLHDLLDAKTDRQLKILSGRHTESQASAAEGEIRSLLAEYQQVEAQIRASSRRYADLTHPEALHLEDIQQHALDPDTLLLAYALGGERSYVWCVSGTSIASYELPKREEIEKAALGAYKEWSENSEERQASMLGRTLLAPLAGMLGQKVAEGALQYVPFAALRAPNGRRLVLDHEIVNQPSASALIALRRELAGRKPASKMAAVFADPVYSSTDPRVKAPTGSAGDPGLDRLQHSRTDADAIAALWPNSNLRALDFDANRARATSGVLANYRIVHFASHGVMNAEHPELSGLVLSLIDEKGNARDGYLRAHEIFNLKLAADLVVLSACRTAFGKDIKGEGSMALTRGFFYAGAARVLASLWTVPDGGAAEIMGHFYRGMRQQHLGPAAALRAAQIAMLGDVRWRDPYSWAGFTIQGDYP